MTTTRARESASEKFATLWLVRALKDLHRDVMESRDRWEALQREGRFEEAEAVRTAARARAGALKSLLAEANALANAPSTAESTAR